MRPGLTFQVLGTGLWAGGATTVLELARLPLQTLSSATPAGEGIEKRTRRRATPLSRAAADAFGAAVRAAGVDASTVPTVFGSALGETPAMIEMVDHVCRSVELSPMRFAVSVHSSSSTVVTISEQNRKLTTSISANFDTVAAALFELAGILATTGGAGVVVLMDDHSPDQFLEPSERYVRLSVALALQVASQEQNPRAATLSLPYHAKDGATKLAQTVSFDGMLTRNPIAGALDLLAALSGDQAGEVELDRGEGSGYRVWVQPARAGL